MGARSSAVRSAHRGSGRAGPARSGCRRRVAGAASIRRRSPTSKLVSITRLAGDEDWPAFSPDGNEVAFSWSGEKSDNTDIYVMLVGTPEVRRLTTDSAVDVGPSWSPDGRHIAFLRIVGRTLRIHVTSPMGGTDLKVSDFPVTSGISWSPDSRFLVAGLDEQSAAGAPAGIYLVPLDGGERRAVTQPAHPNYDNWPAFSRMGTTWRTSPVIRTATCASWTSTTPSLPPPRRGR